MRAFYPPARIGFLRVYPRSPALRMQALARGPIPPGGLSPIPSPQARGPRKRALFYLTLVIMKVMTLKTFPRPGSSKNLRKTFFFIAFVLAVLRPAPAQSTEIDSFLIPFEEKLLEFINQYRARHGSSPLLFDAGLYELARKHSAYMDKRGELSHDHFDQRFEQSGKSFCAENVGWNARTPDAQFKAWRNSHGHNSNMLNKKAKKAGISRVGAYVTFFACD